MKYEALFQHAGDEMSERLELMSERITGIAEKPAADERFWEYFQAVAEHLLLFFDIAQMSVTGGIKALTPESGKSLNGKLYKNAHKDHYDRSFLNPNYAEQMLGEDYGVFLSAVYDMISKDAARLFEGALDYLCRDAELFVEIYNCFEQESAPKQKELHSIYYGFMHDYTEIFNEDAVKRKVNPEGNYALDILMNADLEDLGYLYRYGHYVSENEIESARFLNRMDAAEVQAMADTYTEGYRIGFEVMRKDLSKKTTAEVVYPLGFERMVRMAVNNFAKLGLKVTASPYSSHINRQYSYDHKEDSALYLDKAYVERSLETYHMAYEKEKTWAYGMAGPAVVEVFGEEPFSPDTSGKRLRFTKKQQELMVYWQNERSQIVNRYIKGDERSFTIIAYPLPSIGADYPDIFAETIRLNTLDYHRYQGIQQRLIDVLDTAERVHIQGTNVNKTDLYVSLQPLSDPQKQTIFENCVADVNIPVGEVFTSPVLKGTNGKLHVSQVYLDGLNYENLEIDFKDGMITDYGCTNFPDTEECRRYVKENVLMNHETLPLGEFAIGTNTVAYCMARKYQIADKLPILIAEKTGPHFAVGDTCYSHTEDTPVYNPDGKEIIARDNEVSILRKEDASKAYVNCHTDITIPYDELGRITAIRSDGSEADIIRNGRFVVPGTEELNVPLEEFEKE